jgi:hypothetical protein
MATSVQEAITQAKEEAKRLQEQIKHNRESTNDAKRVFFIYFNLTKIS